MLLNRILNIQHRLNPLHVYCRLVDRGMNARLCICLCKYYEIFIYSWLAWVTVLAARICRRLKPTGLRNLPQP